MASARQPAYSEPSFWRKLKRYAVSAGEQVVEKALQLYFALQSPHTPKWAKTIIISALAYFILPADAVPDVIPAAGYTDDLGALAAALAAVSLYITPEIKQAAREKLAQWWKK